MSQLIVHEEEVEKSAFNCMGHGGTNVIEGCNIASH